MYRGNIRVSAGAAVLVLYCGDSGVRWRDEGDSGDTWQIVWSGQQRVLEDVARLQKARVQGRERR